MKNVLLNSICIVLTGLYAQAQTLTTITGKKIYDHHSSSLSNGYYGYYNVNSQSAYDFVNHTNVPSGVAAQAPDRDLVEHNGPFGSTATLANYGFGFTDSVSNIGTYNYPGNQKTKFYLDPAADFNALNSVQDLIGAYDSTQARSFDSEVAVGDVYIIRVRRSSMYVAMKITAVSNLSQAQLNSLINSQPITADVYFEFDYKYGVLSNTFTAIHENSAAVNPVRLYPNPAAGQLFFSAASNIRQYEIIGIAGSRVAQGAATGLSEGAIDIAFLEPGIYFLELKNDKGILQRGKFIKN